MTHNPNHGKGAIETDLGAVVCHAPKANEDLYLYASTTHERCNTMERIDTRTKNLRKLHRSKQVWESSASSDQANGNRSSRPEQTLSIQSENQELNYKVQYPYTGPSHGEDYANAGVFLRACDAGDSQYVAMALGRCPQLLLKCRGALHIASLHADFATLKALTKHAPSWVLNDTRSVYDDSTALMECARGKRGDAKWRVECFKELLQKGGDLMRKDVNGNTCMHWTVCSGNLLLTKFILLETDASAMLLEAKTVKGMMPVDLINSCCGSNYIQGRMKEIIDKVESGSNIRKRLQTKSSAERRRTEGVREVLAGEMEIVLEEVFESFEACTVATREMFVKAEETRQGDEDTSVNNAVAAATENAIANMDQSALKTLTAQIREELRQQLKSGAFEGKKPQNTSALARRRAEQLILRRKQRDASDRAMIEFRLTRPVIDVAAQMRQLPK